MKKLDTRELTETLNHIDQLLGYDDDFTTEAKISAALGAHREAIQTLCAIVENLNDRLPE